MEFLQLKHFNSEHKMPRIRRFTERLSFYVLPTTKVWFERRSVEKSQPASELYREALEKYQQFNDILDPLEADDG